MKDGLDNPPLLMDLLPTSVKELVHEAERSVTVGHPDFLPAVLCQVGLPRSPSNERTFERTSGTASIAIEAGRIWNGTSWEPLPLPYGIRPRLALVHITTEAVRTGSRHIDVGGSVNAFLTELGLDNGGKAYQQMRLQMSALAACTLRLGRTERRVISGVERSFASTMDAKPFRQFEAWIDNSGHQLSLWPTSIELTEEFFENIRGSSVPLDPHALAKLSRSALALDIYSWLAHRLCRIRTRSGAQISWAALQMQFGTEYKDRKAFKLQFRKRLREVLTVYHDAKVEEIHGGLLLKVSPPPIPKTISARRRLPR